jgi:CheY-like chemotaxis protein
MDSSKRVLVADDVEDIRLSVASLLEAFGHQVACAVSVRTAIRVARSFVPDAALIDLNFRRGRMDGYLICQWLKKRMPACRRVAYTGYGGKHDLLKMEQAGFHRVLLKPCELETLLRAIG